MISLNTQPVEPVVKDDRNDLEVISVFKTIQGEGPFAGYPAVFVRLAGCNLQCNRCDTDYTSSRRTVTSHQLVAEVDDVLRSNGKQFQNAEKPLIVLTGGEPFRQPIGPLVVMLADAGYYTQVETNGTVYRSRFPYHLCGELLSIVCSPKAEKINVKLLPQIDTVKYLVRAGDVDDDGLPKTVLGRNVRPARVHVAQVGQGHARGDVWFAAEDVYVQPEDEGDATLNQANTEAAVASCLKHGYTLSLQLHKYLSLP